jgi:dihydrofolate reductase
MSRKVILGFGISIDGYIARRNGAMDYLVIDKEGESVMAEFFAKIDTTIMGRNTAVGMVKMRKSGETPETPGITITSSRRCERKSCWRGWPLPMAEVWAEI